VLRDTPYRHCLPWSGGESRLKVVGPHSVNRELRTLRAAFYIAFLWQFLDRNPFGGVKLVKTPDVRPCYFSRSDLEEALSVEESWLKELIVFAVGTGVRQSEMLDLT